MDNRQDDVAGEVDRALTELLGEEVVRGRLQPDAMLADDLGADSLDLVELQFELEDRFNISIPDDPLSMRMRVVDVHRVVRDRIAA